MMILIFMVILLTGPAQSEDRPKYRLCETNSDISPSSSITYGMIEHTSSSGQGNCTLRLPKPTSGYNDYVFIEGVRDSHGCADVTIAGYLFCLDSLVTSSVDMRQKSNLEIKAAKETTAFRLNYFFTVFLCNGGSTVVTNTVLAGIVSSNPPGQLVIGHSCSVSIRGLPGNTAVKYESLTHRIDESLQLRIGNVPVSKQSSAGSPQTVQPFLVTSSTGGQIQTNLIPKGDIDETPRYNFALKYTVLRCKAAPRDSHSKSVSYSTNTSLYLPDTTAQYQCDDNYQIRSSSIIRCLVSNLTAVWSDTAGTMCIPVPWCVLPPQNISRATQTELVTNRTAIYECEDGHKSTYSPNITVTCSSTDEDRQPWIWNDTNIDQIFVCSPVQCEVAVVSNINNGTLDNNHTVAYNYGDTVTYECDAGYKKTTTEPIRCLSDKSWSAVPGCDQVHCTKLPDTPNQLLQVQSNSTGTKLVFGEMITVKCVEGYKLRSQNLNRWTCSQSESWVSSNDNSIEYEERLLPLCGKSEGDTDTREGLLTPISTIIIVSSVSGVVCFLLIVVIVVFIRLYNITPKDIKQRIAKKGVKTDQFEEGVEIVRRKASDSVISPDEYEDVSGGPAGVNISGYEQISPRVAAAGSTYENTAYQRDDHEYASLGQ